VDNLYLGLENFRQAAVLPFRRRKSDIGRLQAGKKVEVSNTGFERQILFERKFLVEAGVRAARMIINSK
jgi:hypothetical protein